VLWCENLISYYVKNNKNEKIIIFQYYYTVKILLTSINGDDNLGKSTD